MKDEELQHIYPLSIHLDIVMCVHTTTVYPSRKPYIYMAVNVCTILQSRYVLLVNVVKWILC